METLALITSSKIRMAIVKSLNPLSSSYTILKEKTEEELGRSVSAGSFIWHLEKLRGERVILKTENPEEWSLTPLGMKYSRTIKGIILKLS